jgi:hypothetical protein
VNRQQKTGSLFCPAPPRQHRYLQGSARLCLLVCATNGVGHHVEIGRGGSAEDGLAESQIVIRSRLRFPKRCTDRIQVR